MDNIELPPHLNKQIVRETIPAFFFELMRTDCVFHRLADDC